ncbi:MAG: hypothetical protein AAF577_05605 [Pseudomonadota bacterium]
MLLVSRDGTRSRVWLQDKLWSQRASEQGRQSLRQALTDIRRALGAERDLLSADRRNVSIDLARIIMLPPEDDDAEFLEGFDVGDPEFEDWLIAQRVTRRPAPAIGSADHASVPRPQRAMRPAVLIQTQETQPGPIALTETLFADVIARSIGELLSVEIYRTQPEVAPGWLLLASVQCFRTADGRLGLRATLEDVAARRHVWADMAMAEAGGTICFDDAAFLALSNGLVSALVQEVIAGPRRARGAVDANLLLTLAVRKIFTLRGDNLAEADRMLRDAAEIEPRGLQHAWRAYLYSIQAVERLVPDLDALSEIASACSACALETEHENSYVLAAVANPRRVFDKNYAQSIELARMAVRKNPANPLAWSSLAGAKLYQGDAEAAHRFAVNAHALAQRTAFKPWVDFQRSLTAAVNGNVDEAIRLSESASALASSFRPPVRYLCAMYASDNRPGDAARAVRALKSLEADFTVERLANDPEYPVSLMRRTGLFSNRLIADIEA